jgi:hypothetical protein
MLGLLDTPKGQPDYELFVLSLALEQVVFLNIVLQGSVNQRYYPLRQAILTRLSGEPQHLLTKANSNCLRVFFHEQPRVARRNLLAAFDEAEISNGNGTRGIPPTRRPQKGRRHDARRT